MEHNIISVSGGKDSTALLLLALERGAENIRAMFADTGHEHPHTIEYVAYLSATVHPIEIIKVDFSEQINAKRQRLIGWLEGTVDRWSVGWQREDIQRALTVLHPTGIPFLDLCMLKGRFPSLKGRFCTDELKVKPLTNAVKPLLTDGDDVTSWQGIRADESANRARMTERELKMTDESGAELWIYRPLMQWTVDDVFAMHRKYGIEPNPLYRLGQTRVGCFPCIMTTKENLFQMATRFPDQVARVVEWEKIVTAVSRRQGATFIPIADRRGDSFDKVVEWARTGKGGKNYDLFRNEESLPSCTSAYGLCE